MTDAVVRVGMWSGPRNISTAMMRSWGSRADTAVVDEPLYAHYLTQVDVDHPAMAEVIAHHETDLGKVIAGLTGPVPGGRRVYFQKHMAHHLLPHVPRGWLAQLRNCFLIRSPLEMLSSLAERVGAITLEDTGLPQQFALYEQLRAGGEAPPVLDARDVLENPEAMLRALCDAIDLEFLPEMLAWPAGRRATDGVWARHWYDAVERSTGFQPYRPKPASLPPRYHPLLASCEEIYRALQQHRLRAVR